MLWRFLAIVLLGSCLVGCETRARSAAADAAIDRAELLQKQKKYAEAIAVSDEAIRMEPENVRARWFRALCWYQLDEYDKAIAELDVGIQLDPTEAGMFDNRGTAYACKHDYERAIVDYTEAIRLKPDFAIAYAGRAACWESKQELDRPIADYDEAIRLEPDSRFHHMRRALVLKAKKKYMNALADFEKVLLLDPENPVALHANAWFLTTCSDEKFRNGHKAVELAKKACELSEWRQYLYVDTLAVAYAEAGDFDAAVKYQNQAIELTPDDAKLLANAKNRLKLYGEKKPFREE